MRPKKRVLVVDPDEERRGVTAFMLATNRFRVFPAATAEDAVRLIESAEVDTALLYWPCAQAELLIEAARAARRRVPVVVVRKVAMPCHLAAELQLAAPDGANLLETVRRFSAGKRGPTGAGRYAWETQAQYGARVA